MTNDINLSKQYNNFAEDFVKLSYGSSDYLTSNKFSRETFYDVVGALTGEVKILDIGCGDGTDLEFYGKNGAKLFGIDSSEEMIQLAKAKLPNAELSVSLGENLAFPENSFDFVLSKYAIQTSENMTPIFREVLRILKPGGTFIYLATHPFRQYFERKDSSADYFKQIVVDSNVFQNQITFKEPTHSFNEYLDEFILENFRITFFKEYVEPCAEKVENRIYPGFFIIKAIKNK